MEEDMSVGELLKQTTEENQTNAILIKLLEAEKEGKTTMKEAIEIVNLMKKK